MRWSGIVVAGHPCTPGHLAPSAASGQEWAGGQKPDPALVALKPQDSPEIAHSDQLSDPGIAVMPLAPAAMALSKGLVRRYQA